MDRRPLLDVWASAAAALAMVMTGVYLAVIRQQEGDVAVWYLALLLVAAAAAGYGAVASVPHRRAVLVVGAVLLGAAGVLGILTIGLPVLLAGALCGVAAARASPGSGAPHP